MTESFIAILTASLLASPHCAGMCGGFVLFYSSNFEGRAWPGHIAYHLGRLFSYTVLGAAAGAVGSTLDKTAGLIGLQKAALFVTAVLLIVWGLKGLIFGTAVSEGLEGVWAQRLKGAFAAVLKPGEKANWTIRSGLIGALTGLLPCGLLWAYFLLAAASAEPSTGAMILALFWLGTAPVLVAVGSLSKLLMDRYRKHVPRIVAVLLILAGVSLLSKHMFGQHAGCHGGKGQQMNSDSHQHHHGHTMHPDGQ